MSYHSCQKQCSYCNQLDSTYWQAVCTSICHERTRHRWLHDHDASIPKLKRFCICLPSRNESLRNCFELLCQWLSSTISSLRPARGLTYCSTCNFALCLIGDPQQEHQQDRQQAAYQRGVNELPQDAKDGVASSGDHLRVRSNTMCVDCDTHMAEQPITDDISESSTERKPAILHTRVTLLQMTTA